MAAIDQDFVTYAGNSVSPIFTVLNNAGAVVDISTVSEITWTMRLSLDASVLVTKTKSAGQIQFVTNGTDGKFKVNILPADTTGKVGWYIHTAAITDSNSNVTTVATGRMQVGEKPTWTYNPALMATVPLYQVRRLIGDVLENDRQLLDDEITWLLTQYSNVYSVAGAACRSLAAQFARMVDVVQGEMKTNYSARARQYLIMASQLEARGKTSGGATMVYSGGISNSDKTANVQDTDRVSPQFNIGMDDNLLPIGPVGNQTPTAPAPSVDGVT